MSTTFTCDDKQTLIAYLYGEVDDATRERVDRHLASCASCADELIALGDVRVELGLWAAPDAELGFQIVKKSEQPAPVLRPARWWSTVPVWAQAAAAVLVLGAGLGAANLRIQSGPEGFSVSTGWMRPEAQPAAAPVTTDESWKTALVSLEQELRAEIRAGREQNVVRAAAPQAAHEPTVRRVEQLLAAFEARQERELALRYTQFVADQNLQRRADLLRIQQTFGVRDQEMLRYRQQINNAFRVSASGQQ